MFVCKLVHTIIYCVISTNIIKVIMWKSDVKHTYCVCIYKNNDVSLIQSLGIEQFSTKDKINTVFFI